MIQLSREHMIKHKNPDVLSKVHISQNSPFARLKKQNAKHTIFVGRLIKIKAIENTAIHSQLCQKRALYFISRQFPCCGFVLSDTKPSQHSVLQLQQKQGCNCTAVSQVTAGTKDGLALLALCKSKCLCTGSSWLKGTQLKILHSLSFMSKFLMFELKGLVNRKVYI